MRAKRISASTIAIIVLSVLLVMSVTVAGTVAWFASLDNAAGNFTLGEPVIVSVTQADSTDSSELVMTIPSNTLLPGMLITPDIAVSLSPSTTATILRARIDTTVTGVENNEALNAYFRGVLTPVINNAWVLNEDDGWYYFLGAGGLDARVMVTPAEDSDLVTPEFGATNADYGEALLTARSWETNKGDTVLASVVSGTATKTIPFLIEPFRLPTEITNEYATATIDIIFYVEAVQDFLVVDGNNVLPTLTNATGVFNSFSTYN